MPTVDPQPGDLIEIYRGQYKHWAVYIGDGFVVHLTVPNGTSEISNSCSSCSSGTAVVKKEQLEVVAQGDRWRVHNFMDHRRQHRDANVIVEEALRLVGTQQQYDLISFNCEHFATKLRYGRAQSQQVQDGGKIIAGLSGIGAIAVCGILCPPAALFGFLAYCDIMDGTPKQRGGRRMVGSRHPRGQRRHR